MSEKRRGLGRGLGALIPAATAGSTAKTAGDRPVDVFFADSNDVSPTATETKPAPTLQPEPISKTEDTAIDLTGRLLPVPGAQFAEIDVDAIRPNPRQPRTNFDEADMEELVHSISEIGVLQPIVVRELTSEPGSFELIMGERRWRATKAAKLVTIPAIIKETPDMDMLRDALLENLHRSELNSLEEAAAYQQLLDDFDCTHEELASRIGRSRPQISNTIRLLRLPPAVQRRVASGVLSAGHARALLGMEDSDAMDALAQRIVSEGLSVRAVEEIIAMGEAKEQQPAAKKPRPGTHHAELDDLASRIGDKLDTRVAVTLGRSKGRVSIDFASVEDLNRILQIVLPDVRGVFSDDNK